MLKRLLCAVLALLLCLPAACAETLSDDEITQLLWEMYQTENGDADYMVLPEEYQVPPEGKTGIYHLLLLGIDNPGNELTGRSDTMLLASFNARTGKLKLISFMRDTYVSIPGHGHNKLNAAYSFGGPELLQRHAVETAEAFNAMDPEYIGMLTLMVEPGTPLYDWVRQGTFSLLTPPQVLEETRLLVSHLDSPGSVFRMNHASNYLALKGTLNADRETMLRAIDEAEHDLTRLRPEAWRGL